MVTRLSGRRVAGIVALALITALSACSSSGSNKPAAALTTSATTSTPGPSADSPACVPPVTGAVHVVKDPQVATDYVMTSFDGAEIHVHWFPLATATASHKQPTVLMGPGWGSGGDTNTSNHGAQGVTSIKDLHADGYNVVTWDPRGFGKSTGTIEVDSAQAEARDVERIIDWLATRPNVQLDGPRDPRIGMIGASYGGGIQLNTASIDCRVDAIVPQWAWHSLTTSLDKAATVKTGWSTLLYTVASSRRLDPHIRSAYQSAVTTGRQSAADAAWFASRGPAGQVAKIRVPTLFVQGTVDTLFTLDEAVSNYRILRAHNVPTAMIWYCGGHGVCLTAPGDRDRVERRALLWLDRYVKRDQRVDTGPRFETVDQNGMNHSAPDYPPAPGTPITASGSGTLQLTAAGGSGPAHPPADNPDLLAKFVGALTPAPATNAVSIDVATPQTAAVVVGAPQLRLAYTGTVPAGTRPERVFAQLVDPATGLVVGNQITPIAVVLDGKQHTTTVPLEMVAYTTKPGAHLTLQIVATTGAYALPSLGGSVRIDASLTLPVAANLVPG